MQILTNFVKKLYKEKPMAKKKTIFKKAKDIAIGHTFSIMVGMAAAPFLLTSCGSSNNCEQDNIEFKSGVITKVKEVSPGDFRITDEQVAQNKSDVKVYVEYHDGKKETLSLDDTKKMVKEDPNFVKEDCDYKSINNQHHSSLTSVLLYGTMGYMLGRSLSSPVRSGVYSSQQAYQNSQNTQRSFRNNVVQKPSSSRRGFFGSGSRSSRGGRSYGG